MGLGFVQTVVDYSLFTYTNGASFVIALVYVDDILLTRTDSTFITHVKDFLHSSFTIKDLGLTKYYLLLELHRTTKGLYLYQHKFMYDMLMVVGLEDCKPHSRHVGTTITLSLTTVNY